MGKKYTTDKIFMENGSLDINSSHDGSDLTVLSISSSGQTTFNNGQITLGGTGRIQGVDTVDADTDVANKAYVDAAVATGGGGNFVTLDTQQSITGNKTFSGTAGGMPPTIDSDFATKGYVDSITPGAGVYLPLSGGTLTGPLAGTSATFSTTVTATGGFLVPYAAATKKPMINLVGATNYGLWHTEGSDDIFSFDFGGVSKQQFFQSGNAIFAGDITSGSTAKTTSNVIRSLASDTVTAGFEAYGASQGTGYAYVGQSASYGGGMFYNGDGTPTFATSETADRVSFYRRTANANTVVFDYAHNSNTVNFKGEIYAESGNIVLGGTGRIQGVDTVTDSTDAANKAYVDTKLSLAGGTMANTNLVTNMNADLLDGINSTQFLRSDVDDSFSGAIVSSNRANGIFGTYDSNKTDSIWSMGTAYKNNVNGSNFGNLYGLAYKHTNNTTGGTMAGGHQMVWCANGTGRSAVGDNLWTSGNVIATGTVTGSNLSGTNTGDQDLSGYLLNTTDDFNGTLNIFGGNNNSKESFLNVKRGNGEGEWLKFQTDATSSNNVSEFVIRRNSDSVNLISIAASTGATSFAGDLTVSGGDITLGGTGRIQGIDTVDANTDAANKAYVDNAVAGVPQGDITNVTAGTFLTGGGTSGSVTLNGDHTKLAHIVNSSNGSVTAGWITVAIASSARRAGEIYVTDGESGDHSYVRIEWMRSYADTNFTVLNCGGHANRITGVRVLQETANVTYGPKYLQVQVTTTSNYYVTVTAPGTIPNYTDFVAVTPVLENTKTGYQLTGAELVDLQNSSVGTHEGVTVGGDLFVNGGDIVLGGTGRIQGIDTVSATTDATNKAYVDAAVAAVPIGNYVTLATAQTITGAKTIDTLKIGSANKIQFGNNDFIRYDDANGVGRFHFDSDGGTNNASVQAATFVGALSGNATTATTATTSNMVKVNDYAGATNMRILGSHQTGGSDNVYSNASMYLNCDTGIINATGFVGNLTGNASSATIAAAYLPLAGGAMTGNIAMGNKQITGIDELQFNSGVTIETSGTDNYLDVVYSSTGAGGIRLWDGDSTVQGYLYGDGGATSSFGLLHGSGAWAVRCLENSYVELRYNNAVKLTTSTSGVTVSGTLTASQVGNNSAQTRDKLRVWSGSTYSIGMMSGYGYGGLGGNSTSTEYAMSFQMSNSTNRGWWWGDSSHTNLQGAMSLTTTGKAVIATSLSIGYGESTRTAATQALEVNGTVVANGIRLVSGGNNYLNTSAYSNNAYLYGYASGSTIYFGQPATWTQNIQVSGDAKISGKLAVNTSTIVGSAINVEVPITSSGIGSDFRVSAGSGYSMRNLNVEIPGYGSGIKIYSPSSSSVDNGAMLFVNNGSTVGGINLNTSSTSFNTTSDYRLKENREAILEAIERVKELKPIKFNWIKEPGEAKVDGFYAHELAEVVPEAVTGEKDALDWEGNPAYQSIDQAKIVPLLTAALQQAIDKIEALELRINKLEKQ